MGSIKGRKMGGPLGLSIKCHRTKASFTPPKKGPLPLTKATSVFHVECPITTERYSNYSERFTFQVKSDNAQGEF